MTCRFFLALFICLSVLCQVRASDSLPSWNEGPAKAAILKFVSEATDQNSKNYIPPQERIATFDQDGTLWTEQPIYAQWVFAIDRLKAMAPRQPSWWNQQIAAVAAGKPDALAKLSKEDIEVILTKTHSGMSTDEFTQLVQQWLKTALHPKYKKPYTDLVYQPMIEVIQLLRDSGFKVYIVTGSGQAFTRAFAETVYGVPPEEVIGTADKLKYEYRDGKPVLIKLPQLLFIDNYQGKPESISLAIGRRPVASFGNSDGDRQMLEWTQAGQGARLEMLVYHDDAEREYAYGPNSKVGTFSNSLMQQAKKDGWVVISMKNDWKAIFKEGSQKKELP